MKKILFLLLALGLTLTSIAEEGLEFTSKVNKEEVYIGDKITLKIE